ncbi:MAG: hypothetical protein P8Q26_14740 [Ascidiaceihabitans sp.]|nr:hypothetical protein [Ascidiaceihabitans sp.]
MTKAILAYVIAMLPAAVMADAWDEFEARCLLPFEHFAPVVADDLERLTSVRAAVFLSPNAIQFTLPDNMILYSDPAPIQKIGGVFLPEGEVERLCGVQGTRRDVDQGLKAWIEQQREGANYETVLQSYSGGFTMLVSAEWIEPRLVLTVKRDQDTGRVDYSIMETDLES